MQSSAPTFKTKLTPLMNSTSTTKSNSNRRHTMDPKSVVVAPPAVPNPTTDMEVEVEDNDSSAPVNSPQMTMTTTTETTTQTTTKTTNSNINDKNFDTALSVNALHLKLLASKEETRVLKRQFLLFREDAKKRVERAQNETSEANEIINELRQTMKDNKADAAKKTKKFEKEISKMKSENEER